MSIHTPPEWIRSHDSVTTPNWYAESNSPKPHKRGKSFRVRYDCNRRTGQSQCHVSGHITRRGDEGIAKAVQQRGPPETHGKCPWEIQTSQQLDILKEQISALQTTQLVFSAATLTNLQLRHALPFFLLSCRDDAPEAEWILPPQWSCPDPVVSSQCQWKQNTSQGPVACQLKREKGALDSWSFRLDVFRKPNPLANHSSS